MSAAVRSTKSRPNWDWGRRVYELRMLESAARDLQKLDVQIARRILARLRWLAENFDNIRPEALTGDMAGLLKLRVGDYCVI